MWCASFNAAVATDDGPALGALFAEDSYWRDMLTLDDRIQTAHGPVAIRDMFARATQAAKSLRIAAAGEVQTEKIPGIGDVVGTFISYEMGSAEVAWQNWTVR